MKTKKYPVTTIIKVQCTICPKCGGSGQVDCPGEKYKDKWERCSSGRVTNGKDYHSLCNGTSLVGCKFCGGNNHQEGSGKTQTYYRIEIVQVNEDRFAFAVYPNSAQVLFHIPVRYSLPANNGSGLVESFWTRPGREFPEEEK